MNVLAGLLVWAALSGLAWGQGTAGAEIAKRPMTFRDLMAMKRVSDPQVSPSGKWVMFSVMEVSLENNTKVNNLWVVPLGGGGTTADSSAALLKDKQRSGQKQGGTEADPSAALRNNNRKTTAERQLTFGVVNQTNGRFSPDGKWILLVSPGGGTSQIWTAKWDDATGTIQKPYPLTSVATEADGAVWSPDSKRILFVSSVYPECSDKPVWAEEDACNKSRMEAEAKDPVKAQMWDHLFYRHWNAFTGERRSHVLVVDFPDGEKVRDLTPRSAVGDAETPTFSLGGPLGYAWAPDSREIAYVTNLDRVPAASTNNDVFTLRIDEPGAKAVKVSTSPGSDDGPQYSPDGRWLAFRSQARAGYESDRFRLMVLDRGTGATRELMPKFDRWVDEFVWAPDSGRIYFVSGDTGNTEAFSVQLSGQKLIEVGGRLSFEEEGRLNGEVGDIRISPDGGTLIESIMHENEPTELQARSNLSVVEEGSAEWHAFEPGAPYGEISQRKFQEAVPNTKSTLRRLTNFNEMLVKQLELSGPTTFWFTGAEDAQVEGFIVRPPNFNPAKKYPVKFLIHGGPQGAWGDAWSYRWNPELFAADGYVVVMVNPRGSTGYGQAFVDGVNGDWGGKAYVDLMRGLDAAEAKFPFIDKTRECALGGSYGGFMANWILTHPDPRRPDRFKCIVTHDGMYNPAAAYGDTEEMWFNEWEFRRAGDYPQGTEAGEPGQPWRYAVGPASEDPFRRWSPMLSIQNAKTPTLVIHSQKDYRLDVSEGFQLFTALQRLGVPSKMLYFPDEGHWVLKPRNSELWYQTVNDWCDRWTHTNKYAGVQQ